ncbi:MAG: TIR domain-containing protein [Octadecabacter sp.]
MRVGILSSHFEDYKIGTELGYETRHIIREIELLGGSVSLLDPTNLRYGILDNRSFASFCSVDDSIHDIGDLDVLLVRRTRGHVEAILDFIEFAQRANSKLVVCDPIRSFGRPTSKVESILRRVAKFPQPDTQVLNVSHSGSISANYPVFVKPSHGTGGRGARVCNNAKELQNQIDAIGRLPEYYSGYGVLVQENLKIDEEFRVVVVNGVALGCASKSEPAKDLSVRNARTGSRWQDYDEADKNDIEEFAVSVSKFLEQDISGVDLIRSNGKLYLIESNRNPQFEAFDFATRTRTAESIAKMLFKKSEVEFSPHEHLGNNAPNIKFGEGKSRIFIGSSSEHGLEIAEALQFGLDRVSESTVWNQGVFEEGDITLVSLEKAVEKFDYAVFCITPDDFTTVKSKDVFEPRDNVIFEAGLFMGSLGRERVILVVCRNDWPSLPSDLDGMTVATWARQSSGNLQASIAPAVTAIKRKWRLS